MRLTAALNCQLEKLKELRTSEADAYRMAEEQNSDHVRNRKFRLKFLRADKYNPRKAAERTLRFFTEKLRLFGPEKLTQETMHQDLSKDDIETLETGALQFPTMTDRAGRKILVALTSQRKNKTLENLERATFYFFCAAVKAESDQINGLVMVTCRLGKPVSPISVDQHVQNKLAQTKLSNALPARVAVAHVCLENSRVAPAIRMSLKHMDKVSMFTHRFHCGTHLECMHALNSFGIPIFALPFRGEDGATTFENHWRWINERKASDMEKMKMRSHSNVVESSDMFMEEPLSNTGLDEPNDLISWSDRAFNFAEISEVAESACDRLPNPGSMIEPAQSDVLFGRGNPIQSCVGNVQFRKIVASRFNEHENSSKLKKTEITRQVIDAARDTGGRFLKPANQDIKASCRLKDVVAWEEVDDNAARQKVAIAFRSVRKTRC